MYYKHLQTVTVVMFPRLNIVQFPALAKFGLLHLVTNNVIIWIFAIVQESIHEIHEAVEHEEEASHHENVVSEHHEECKKEEHFNNFLGDTLKTVSPILFPFLIEFVLIGATIFYEMWHHVGPYPGPDKLADSRIHKPHPRTYISKINTKHSLLGFFLGIFVAVINFVNLGIFYRFSDKDDSIDEYIGDITNTAINLTGIVASIIGLVQIQKVPFKTKEEESSLDIIVLNISSFFMYLYACLTLIVGFATFDEEIPSELIIINGMVDIIHVTCQVTFLLHLLQKVCHIFFQSHKKSFITSNFYFIVCGNLGLGLR